MGYFIHQRKICFWIFVKLEAQLAAYPWGWGPNSQLYLVLNNEGDRTESNIAISCACPQTTKLLLQSICYNICKPWSCVGCGVFLCYHYLPG